MPSIKTCLTSLAMLAMAFAPIAEANSHIVERDINSIRAARAGGVAAARAAGLRSASVSTASATTGSSKVAVTKSKSKPAVGSFKGATKVKAYNPYHKNSKFMSSKAVKYVTSFRCRSDATCNDLLSPIFPRGPNGEATARGICQPNSRQCSVTCIEGYVPRGVLCVPEVPNCANENCAQFANGYNTCNRAGRCRYSCYDGYRLAASSSGGQTSVACLALDSDVNNCGKAGNVCPQSYNGVGTPRCNSGCTLRCPRGLTVKPANSASNPLTCYGPGVPLTQVN